MGKEGGVSSPQGKKKMRAKISTQGMQCTQEEISIVISKIPNEVKNGDNMVGGVDDLEYSNHDVLDATLGTPMLELAEWILGLYNTGIMNLLDIWHFERGKYINGCVKQFLARVHGGILWMDRPVPINFDLIVDITGIPIDGEKPKKYLEEKAREKSISNEIKEKYGTERGNRGIKINNINDLATRFATRIIDCKLMRKC
jgi:hypothetical protein